jgi:hypothetical protein
MSGPTWELELGPERWLSWWHNCSDNGGRRVLSRLPLGVPHGWTVERLEPLTLSPSIRCLGCGVHGFVRGGQWSPA